MPRTHPELRGIAIEADMDLYHKALDSAPRPSRHFTSSIVLIENKHTTDTGTSTPLTPTDAQHGHRHKHCTDTGTSTALTPAVAQH